VKLTAPIHAKILAKENTHTAFFPGQPA